MYLFEQVWCPRLDFVYLVIAHVTNIWLHALCIRPKFLPWHQWFVKNILFSKFRLPKRLHSTKSFYICKNQMFISFLWISFTLKDKARGGRLYTSDYYDFFFVLLFLSLVPPPPTTIHSHTIIITIIALGRLRERLMSF